MILLLERLDHLNSKLLKLTTVPLLETNSREPSELQLAMLCAILIKLENFRLIIVKI